MTNEIGAITTMERSILELALRFRFLSALQLSSLLPAYAQEAVRLSLRALEIDGFINRSGRVPGTGQRASHVFSLNGQGVRSLKMHGSQISVTTRNLYYQNVKATPATMLRYMAIVELEHALRVAAPHGYTMRSRIQMEQLENVVSPKPDGYFTLPTDAGTRHFFVQWVSDDMPTFAIRKLATRHQAWIDDGGWDLKEAYYPTILLLFESRARLDRLRLPLWRDGDESIRDLRVYGLTLPDLADLADVHPLRLGGTDAPTGFGIVDL